MSINTWNIINYTHGNYYVILIRKDLYKMESLFVICAILMLVCWIVYGAVSIFKGTGKTGKEMKDRLSLLKSMIDLFVVAENQTFVNECKEKNPNGKLTEEQAKEVKQRVTSNIMECLEKSDLLNDVMDIFGVDKDDEDSSLSAIISTMIEACVYENKGISIPKWSTTLEPLASLASWTVDDDDEEDGDDE
jgi:hypothetical protein